MFGTAGTSNSLSSVISKSDQWLGSISAELNRDFWIDSGDRL
jgi:hypothetical protein